MVSALVVWIVVGIIAGWAAGKIMKGKGFGVGGDLVLGILGAILGGWLVGLLGFAGAGLLGTTIVAIIGACVLIGLSRMLAKA
jgi:uncharacterized membrane protein YeaQ/YmgE (transglycosylase-associated protein family)